MNTQANHTLAEGLRLGASRALRGVGSALLAGALLCTTILPGFAAGGGMRETATHGNYRDSQPKTNISLTGTADGWKAYRILDLTTRLKIGSDPAKDVSGHDLTAPDGHTEDCYTYAYTVNSAYNGALQAAFTALDDAGENYDTSGDGVYSLPEILAALEGIKGDADRTRAFADEMYTQLKSGTLLESPDATASGAADAWSFSDVEQGYYIILEDAPTGTKTDHISKAVLDTAGQLDLEIRAKDGTTTFVKEVLENTPDLHTTPGIPWTDGWGAAADYALGDKVPFRLNATLGQNLTQFKSYQLVFHDELAEGLTIQPEDVSGLTVTLYNADNAPHKLALDTEYTVKTEDLGDSCDLEVTVTDVRALTTAAAENECRIVVEYSATLTGESVVYGNDGNDNTAWVTYSSNPYESGQTQETPKSTVTVFTYLLQVEKTDSEAHPLDGAGFTLYQLKQDVATKPLVGTWSEQADDNWTQVKEKSWSMTSEAGSGNVKFNFAGLETGIYKLEESRVPDGYYPAPDLYFRVDAEFQTDGGEHTVKTLNVLQESGDAQDAVTASPATATAKAGMGDKDSAGTWNLHTTIENIPGVKLPSTGGTGVYALYAAGAAALALCAALLIARGRTRKD